MAAFLNSIETVELKKNRGSRTWMKGASKISSLFKKDNTPGQSLLEGIERHGTTQLQQTNKMVEAKTRGTSVDSGEAVEEGIGAIPRMPNVSSEHIKENRNVTRR